MPPGLCTWLGGSSGREGSGLLPGPAARRGGGVWPRRWGGASTPTFLGGALTEVPRSPCGMPLPTHGEPATGTRGCLSAPRVGAA